MLRSKIIPKILCWLAALIGFSSTSYAETGPKSLLGMSLSEAEKTEYFGWFHLREIDRQTDARGQTTVSFKPEGESRRNGSRYPLAAALQICMVCAEKPSGNSVAISSRQARMAVE